MRSTSPFERYAEPVPLQDARLQFHIVVEGETLSSIAHQYYGDWRMWTLIAERNQIADVRKLAPGTRLIIPPRPLQSGAFESA